MFLELLISQVVKVDHSLHCRYFPFDLFSFLSCALFNPPYCVHVCVCVYVYYVLVLHLIWQHKSLRFLFGLLFVLMLSMFYDHIQKQWNFWWCVFVRSILEVPSDFFFLYGSGILFLQLLRIWHLKDWGREICEDSDIVTMHFQVIWPGAYIFPFIFSFLKSDLSEQEVFPNKFRSIHWYLLSL